MATTKQICAAGTLLLEHVVVYRELVGDAAVDQALDAVAPEVRAAYESCVPGAWIDVEVSVQLYAAIADAAGRDVVELHAKAIEIGYGRALKGLWRSLMLRVATDKALIGRAPTLYAKTFDGGHMTGELLGPGRAQLTIVGWPEMPQVHRHGIAAGMRTVLELAGRREASVDHGPTDDGARYRLAWSA